MDQREPVITLVREGTPYLRKSRYSSRKVKINREWVVELDDKEIGRIYYDLCTRERAIKGARHVAARWQTPGWLYSVTPGWRRIETDTKKSAVRRIVERTSK